jgi:beta-lactamase regulating signal transducer with metallopeptidase domain
MHMTAMVEIISALEPVRAAWRVYSQSAAEIFVTSLWQSAATACGLALCLKIVPKFNAAHRFAIWAAGFVIAASLTFLPLIERLFVLGNSGPVIGLGQAATRPWIQLDIRWSLAIAALWGFVSIIRATDLLVHSIRLRRLWKSATPIELSESLASSLVGSGRRRVEICSSNDLERPSVIGFFAPRILIPAWLLARLAPGQLDQIVMHEAEHLRRGDDWTNLLQKLWLVIFPLNPALWWMEHRLCREREMACDEGVVKRTHAPRAYAACLASLAERGLEHRVETQTIAALSLGAWQRRPELAHRVHGILLRKHGMNPIATGALLGALGCGLVGAAVELAKCPQLVAFVPPQNAVKARAIKPALRQVDAEQKTASGFDTGDRVRVAPGYYAMEAKAVMPEGRRPTSSSLVRPQRPNRKASAATEIKLASAPPRVAEKSNLSKQEGVEQWVVFTAWEQVQSENRTGGALSDYAAGDNAEFATSNASAQDGSQLTKQPNNRSSENRATQNPVPRQFTIMQLIFRVLPAGSLSAQPDAQTVREGWIVIQL